jgi:hypothetical protein
MKTTRIDVKLSKKTMKKLQKIVYEVQSAPVMTSFLLQVYPSGDAIGLALSGKDSEDVAEVLKPIWDRAELGE